MPCSAVARGMRTTTAIPPFTGTSTQPLPFNDAVNNTPCARRITTNAGGVDYTAQSLCLFHLQMKLGLLAVQAPYVDAP